MSKELLGPHQQIVEELFEQLEALQRGDDSVPPVAVLRAPSGMGKSRIIRELYTRMQQGQPSPGFWPPLTVPGGEARGEASPLAERKVIGPPVEKLVWPEAALPSFGWWTFNCERLQTGDRASVLAASEQELRALVPPLTQAWSKAAGLWDRLLAQQSNLAGLLRDAAADELTDAALDQLQTALNVALPGIGTLSGLLWKAGRWGRDKLSQAADLREQVHLGERAATTREDAARELAGLIRRLSHRKLPGVVVVEDAHLMATEMKVLLSELARPVAERPVLVVLTAWPEGDLRPEWQEWLEETVQAGAARIVDVPALVNEDLVRIVRWHAPKVDDRDARLLAQTFGSPLLLQLWLTMPSIQRYIAHNDQALPVSDDMAAELPQSVADIYRQRWNELTPQVQQSLAAAIVLTDPNDPVPSFLPEIVSRASEFLIEPSEMSQGLALATDPAAWMVLRDEVATFREEPLAAQARDGAVGALHAGAEIELRARAIKHVEDLLRAHLEDDYTLLRTPTTEVAAEWYLDLIADEPWDTKLAIASAWLCACIAAEQFRYAAGIHLAESILPHVDPSVSDGLHIRSDLASWSGEVGRVSDAVDHFESLLEVQTRVSGQDHPDTLTVRNNLALWLCRSGRLPEAIEEFEALLGDRVRVLGPDHPDTLTTRNNLASRWAESGGLSEAIEEFGALLADRVRVLGPDHPDTLTTRNNLAFCWAESGGLSEAIEEFEALLGDRVRVLGADHPDTLMTRHNRAFCLGECGRLSEAIEEFEALVPDFARVLGPDHPETLTTRDDLASRWAESGRLSEAIEEFEALVADQSRVFGPDHWVTQSTRDALADWSKELTGEDNRE